MTNIETPTGTLNFSRLAELLEAEAGLKTGTGRHVLQTALNIIARHVAAGVRVRLTNFGSFWVLNRKISENSLPSRGGARVTSVKHVRFRATGLFADVVKTGAEVGTLRKRGKGQVGQ